MSISAIYMQARLYLLCPTVSVQMWLLCFSVMMATPGDGEDEGPLPRAMFQVGFHPEECAQDADGRDDDEDGPVPAVLPCARM